MVLAPHTCRTPFTVASKAEWVAPWIFGVLALGCCLAGCDRHSAPVASAAPSTPSEVVRAPCVRPFADVAPPAATRAASCPPDAEGNLDLGTVEIVFGEAAGEPRIVAEHALSDAARERGLMFRTELPEDAGMLFTWDDERPRTFWMKNTCLPLDMIFIDGRDRIVSVLEQVPTLNLQPRPGGCPAQHVLEVNAGWARQHGVRPGQRVRIGT